MSPYLSAFTTTLLLLCCSMNAGFQSIIRHANASSTLAIDAIEAVLVAGTVTWVTHINETAYQGNDLKNQNYAIEVWDLKDNTSTDYIMANDINNAIVDEGMSIIKENFPEVYATTDENTLRNIILLNIAKNTSNEE